MKAYAQQWLAKKFLRQYDLVVYVAVVDEPGAVGFKFPNRLMTSFAEKLKAELPHERYEFQRTAHFIADIFVIDEMRSIRLQQNFGASHATVTFFDNEELP